MSDSTWAETLTWPSVRKTIQKTVPQYKQSHLFADWMVLIETMLNLLMLLPLRKSAATPAWQRDALALWESTCTLLQKTRPVADKADIQYATAMYEHFMKSYPKRIDNPASEVFGMVSTAYEIASGRDTSKQFIECVWQRRKHIMDIVHKATKTEKKEKKKVKPETKKKVRSHKGDLLSGLCGVTMTTAEFGANLLRSLPQAVQKRQLEKAQERLARLQKSSKSRKYSKLTPSTYLHDLFGQRLQRILQRQSKTF